MALDLDSLELVSSLRSYQDAGLDPWISKELLNLRVLLVFVLFFETSGD